MPVSAASGPTTMSRPALSASRAIEIIDFMSQAPSQAYSMSELVRHTGTNVASCHAILNVLVTRGYLARHPTHKTYRLAPALAGIGEAVAASTPLLALATAAVRQLARQSGLEATLTLRAGEDILCLGRESGSPRLRNSMRVGQRVPLRPPLGAIFYAWASADEIESWLALGAPTDTLRHRAALELVRQRGFLVTLASSAQDELRRLFASPHGAADGRGVRRALQALEEADYQPARLEPGASYVIDFISTPIFDTHDQATYALNLSGFEQPLSGAEVIRHAERMLELCDGVMHEGEVRRPKR